MTQSSGKRRTRALSALLAAALMAATVVLAACGGGSDNSNGAGNGTDVAFVDGMVPHHDSAIDMAKTAQKRGQSAYVKGLADQIVQAQASEITVMKAIEDDLDGVKSADLKISAKDMGMNMNPEMLATASPFDREFIDMMIPHHQGAIRMARVELANGKSKALKDVADKVIAAQTAEINQMNAYRKKTFGADSPAGGVPAATESTDGGGSGHEGMDGI